MALHDIDQRAAGELGMSIDRICTSVSGCTITRKVIVEIHTSSIEL